MGSMVATSAPVAQPLEVRWHAFGCSSCTQPPRVRLFRVQGGDGDAQPNFGLPFLACGSGRHPKEAQPRHRRGINTPTYASPRVRRRDRLVLLLLLPWRATAAAVMLLLFVNSSTHYATALFGRSSSVVRAAPANLLLPLQLQH